MGSSRYSGLPPQSTSPSAMGQTPWVPFGRWACGLHPHAYRRGHPPAVSFIPPPGFPHPPGYKGRHPPPDFPRLSSAASDRMARLPPPLPSALPRTPPPSLSSRSQRSPHPSRCPPSPRGTHAAEQRADPQAGPHGAAPTPPRGGP